MSRRKKGISTIVGALFFTVVIMIALATMSWTSQQQHAFTTTAREAERLQLERISSSLEITNVRFVQDGLGTPRFNITIQNNGPMTEKIVRLWVTNESSTWHNNYDVSYLVNPKQSVTIGPDLPLVADDAKSYTFKAVTERGNIFAFRAVSAYDANLKLVLSIVPPGITINEDVTVILSVTNDQTDVDAVHHVNPALSNYGINCGQQGQPLCPNVTQIGSNPAPVESLLRGSTATFKWEYDVAGTTAMIGSSVRFNATVGGNSVADDLEVINIDAITQADYSSRTGTLTIEYESLRYIQSNNCTNPLEEDDWQQGWRLYAQNSGWTAFRINITNHDPADSFTLDKRSAFFLAGVDTGINNAFFIVRKIQENCGQTTDPFAYDWDANSETGTPEHKIIIGPNGDQRMIFFASSKIGQGDNKNLTPKNIYAGNFVMFGRLGSIMYGQNIPFVGIEVVESP